MKALQNNSYLTKGYKFSENAFLPKEVVISLCQESNVICKSMVKPGDVVEEGQVIASGENSDGNVTYIHSSIPGTVTEIISTFCPDGKVESAVKISLGGSFSYLGKKIDDEEWKTLDSEQITKKICEKGVVNTFDCLKSETLGYQLDKSEYVIVRLFDEDIMRISDCLLANFFIDQIKTGARIIAKAVGAKALVYAVNERFNLDKLDLKNTEETSSSVKEIVLKNKSHTYPAGSKNVLAYNFNKISKKHGLTKISDDFSNVLFVDDYAACDVYNAVVKNTPSTGRYVHISGNSLYASCFLNVKIGCTLRDILNQLGGYASKPAIVIINGSICGYSVNTIDVPVTRYVKSIEFVSKAKMTDSHIYSCVNCGKCRFVCPANISPDILCKHVNNQLVVDKDIIKSVLLCTECGLCNTVCQSRLPLKQMLSLLKSEVALQNQNVEETTESTSEQ